MKMRWIFIVALAGCASKPVVPPVLPTEKEFAVPTKLADQFAVHDNGAVPIASSPAVDPAKKEEGPVTKKGKKAKAAEAKASALTKAVPNRWTMPPIFRPGKRAVFDITYFGATAGQLALDTLSTKVVANRPTYHFRATANTSSVFSLFYRLNDVAESFMDTEGLFSHKYSIQLDETKQKRDVLELYDHQKNKAYYWSKLVHTEKGVINDQSEIKMVPFTQDGLSAFFYVRTLPLKDGGVYEFPVVNNGKLRTVRVTVVRREELKTKVGEFPAIVVKPEVVLDGVLSTYGDSFIWISDDDKRAILKVDAKIKVGSVIAYLRELSYGDQASAK